MFMSRNPSKRQGSFSKLLLQCVVYHSQAQRSVEEKLEVKHICIFLIFLGGWLVKSKNEARILGL